MPKIPIPNGTPTMPVCCKTCPFRVRENGQPLNRELANAVMERNLFKSVQICHNTQGYDRHGQIIPKHLCKGYADEAAIIYERLLQIKSL